MPRASIPSPRLLACADPPFLPFLAPRAFAETPVSKNKPHEGTRKRYQKEKGYGRNDKLESVLNSPRCDATVQERRWRIRTKPPTTKSHAGRTLSNAFQSSGVFRYDDYLSRKNPNRHSLDQRYADIFSFAPQQTRNYNTKHLAAKSEERWPSNVARANQPRNREGIARKAALATEQMRMDNFLSYEPGLLESDFLKKGRYRSLRRRILNLQQRTVSTVKMGEYNDNDRSSLHDGLMLAFAALDQEAYPRLRRITSPIRIQHDPRCVEWASRLWMDVEEDKHNAETVQLNWKKFSEKETKECWHHLLIYFLHLMPARAIILIEILGHETDVWALHPHILADSLNCLAMTLTKERRHASDQILTSGLRTLRKTFVPFFYHNFRRHLIQHSQVCPQDLFCSVVDMADMEELKTVFDLLVEARTYLGYDTLLHYANAFARGGENELALRCLTEIKKRNNAVGWQAVVNRDRFRWTCALILRQSTKKGHNYHGVPGILATFVELGVKLDILLYNVVMNNAMDVGDHVTAFKVYNALEKNGMRPGRDTFSIMLHGCTRQSTPAMFHDFAEYCAEMAIEMKSPRLAAGYLHYFYICHQDDSNLQRTSTELLHVYARFFNLDLLEPFLGKTREELKRLIDENQSSSISEPLMPPPLAVYIILQTAIRNAFEESNERVWGLYQLFKRVVQDNNDSPVKSLAKEPIIWNAFLLAFCKRQQFARASAVITDMTDNSPQPNIYSWNIFMQSFFKTGQIRAAERVFEIMRNRHIEPDQYSYGILLRGYAKAQMLEQIEQKIEHLDAENQLDPDLLQALIRVHDRKKLLVALENNRLEQVRRAREKSIREAEEFERRWQPRLASVSSPQPPTASELFNGPRQFRADHGRSESIASQPNIRTSGRDTD